MRPMGACQPGMLMPCWRTPWRYSGEDCHHREDAKRVKASAQRGIYYGWVIVLVSFLTMLLVMGTRFSFGVFYSSMLTEMRVRCWAPVKLIGTEVTAARLRQARVDELAN